MVVNSRIAWFIQVYLFIYIYIWRFPKIGVPPKSFILRRFSIKYHPFWGTPISHFRTPPHLFMMYIYIYIWYFVSEFCRALGFGCQLFPIPQTHLTHVGTWPKFADAKVNRNYPLMDVFVQKCWEKLKSQWF